MTLIQLSNKYMNRNESDYLITFTNLYGNHFQFSSLHDGASLIFCYCTVEK